MGLDFDQGNVSQGLYEYAKTLIPGGTQLFGKRGEMFAPGLWPTYFSKAEGCEVWDLDGRHYYDVGKFGIGACVLGFRDPDVTEAVMRRIDQGSFCTLNSADEVELADLLCQIHPWAEQVRFARTGGEIASVAIRIARATTKRSMVAVCGYHGWHDWYLAANLGESDVLDGHLLPGLTPLGTPRELQGTTVTFGYNHPEQFEEVIARHGDQLAAVIMEPVRFDTPKPGFLEAVREGAHKCGAMLIFDEITIGWKLYCGGAHMKFGVEPDIAIFAKSTGGGHPMAAVIGTKEAMSGAHGSFISSTYWTESVGPAAALTAIKKMQKIDVPAHLEKIGRLVWGHWKRAAEKHGLKIKLSGDYGCMAAFAFDHELAAELNTLYVQLMLERGFLAQNIIFVSLAHTEPIIELYGKAIDEVFGLIAEAIAEDKVLSALKGPVAHTGFVRLN